MKLTRGDTGHYNFQRLDSSGHVILTSPLKMFFTMKSSLDEKEVVVQKKLEDFTMDNDGTWHFTLLPEDTESLPYGKYPYDIEVTIDVDEVYTIVEDDVIDLTKEATWSDNK